MTRGRFGPLAIWSILLLLAALWAAEPEPGPPRLSARPSVGAAAQGRWMCGDLHQHTTYSDGDNPIRTVNSMNHRLGLDWWANADHGGGFTKDGYGPILSRDFDTGRYARYWDDRRIYPPGNILGDVSRSHGHRKMWRWQSIREHSFADMLAARSIYKKRVLIQGLEWNVPGHEHASVAILTGQFGPSPNARALAAFEYMFDDNDRDKSGGRAQGWTKSRLTGHAKAMEAARWLQANHPGAGWLIPVHPEHENLWRIEDFRDLSNAAPSYAFGFEGISGNQKTARIGYSNLKVGHGTYGGAGIFTAQIGGLWDALLGEGRAWWLFTNSDFHSTKAAFWPGEYGKSWTFVADQDGDGSYSAQEIVAALRAGTSFVVLGDLINGLDFRASTAAGEATMGQTLRARKGETVRITIRFKSPAVNRNGDAVAVHHIDLISGTITGRIRPSDPAYKISSNPTTRIKATFDGGDWTVDSEGWLTVGYNLKNVRESAYIRLRGTNLPPGTLFETDDKGNPILDYEAVSNLGIDGETEAWRDLWFYSNPIFIKVR